MKLLYYFEENDTVMWAWQRTQIFAELKDHGVDVEVFNPLNYGSYDESNEKLLSYIRQSIVHYDLFMTPHMESKIYPETIDCIKTFGIATVLFCIDNDTIPYAHRHICSHFDLVWLASPGTLTLFESWGAKCLYMPFAANPSIFHPDYEQEIEKIGFIGTPYGTRANSFNILLDNNIPLQIHTKIEDETVTSHSFANYPQLSIVANMFSYSIGRKLALASAINRMSKSKSLNTSSPCLNIQPRLSYDDMVTMYSKFALSFATSYANNTAVLKHPVSVINLRSFEIPMCGGLQFANYDEKLASFFEEDKEIVFYRTNDEMIEKARYYLSPSMAKTRRAMKENARRRSEIDHCWWNRFSNIFSILGIRYE